MIINVENEKGLNAHLSFECIWSTFDSYLVKKYCDFFKNHEMMNKLQAFEIFLSNSTFVKKENENFFYDNPAIAYPEKETLNYQVYNFIKKKVNPNLSGNSYYFFDETILNNDTDFDKNKKNYGFITFSNFIGSTSTKNFEYITRGDWNGIGFEALEDFVKNKEAYKLYEELMTFLTNRKDVPKSRLKDFNKLISKKQKLTIYEFDPLSRLVSSDAYLIYFSNYNGYLDYKGNVAPLSGARLFESAIQAERTANARGIRSDVIIVQADISLTAITNQISLPSSGIGDLGQGITELEKRKIKENLAKVTMEDLEAQIKILNDKLEENGLSINEEKEEEVQLAPVKRKRM